MKSSLLQERISHEEENIHALRETLNELLWRIDPALKRNDNYIFNNLKRALKFMKYAERPFKKISVNKMIHRRPCSYCQTRHAPMSKSCRGLMWLGSPRS